MNNKKIQLKTKRLYMEPKTLEQLLDAAERETDPEMKKAYQEMADGVKEHPEDWLWYTDWNISLKKEGTVIGGIGFKGAPNAVAEVEIGYGIDEAYRRQGYGFEAVSRMLEWAFGNEKVYFVMAETLPDHMISQGLLKKAGFVETGAVGEEGPRYEKERPEAGYLSLYLSLGMCIGISIGLSLFDNMALGMSLGMGVGACLGSAMDAQDKKKRDKLREQRKGTTSCDSPD